MKVEGDILYQKHAKVVSDNTSGPLFSTFPLWSEMSVTFYHSVIHSSGFFNYLLSDL